MLDKMTDDISRAFAVEKLPFRRNLTVEELRKLQAACNRAFNTTIHIDIIEKVMDYCCYVERNMKGRAAGNIEDMIIRYLFRFYGSTKVKTTDKACHLEIGALFGAATIFSCHAVRLSGKDIVTVVIDPFEGYYGQKEDNITRLPVDQNIFWKNLARFGYSKHMVEVQKGHSNDENILKQIQNYRVLSLLLDGDHSYEGLKSDWMNYSPLVVPGGFVLIDDYNSHVWPDVSKFVNKEILSNLTICWEVILVFGSSIILQRTDYIDSGTLSEQQVLFHQLKAAERKIELKDKETNELIRQQKEEISRLSNEMIRLRNTWSWRITSPLRWLYGQMKKNR